MRSKHNSKDGARIYGMVNRSDHSPLYSCYGRSIEDIADAKETWRSIDALDQQKVFVRRGTMSDESECAG